MIAMLLQGMDVASLWVTWWCAAAMLAAGQEVRTWRHLASSVGLLGVMVFSFTGAIALSMDQPLAQPLWSTGLRIAVAVVALVLYEYRFGIVRHVRMVRGWLRTLPQRIGGRPWLR